MAGLPPKTFPLFSTSLTVFIYTNSEFKLFAKSINPFPNKNLSFNARNWFGKSYFCLFKQPALFSVYIKNVQLFILPKFFQSIFINNFHFTIANWVYPC